MNTAKTTQEFISGIKNAAKDGQVFEQVVGIADALVLTVSPDGGAVCHLFGEQVDTLPAGNTPDEVLTFWSGAVRKFAPAYGDTSGTMTFVNDMKVGDIIVDDDGLNAKVVYMISDGDYNHVTLVSHGYADNNLRAGKQIQKFVQYFKSSMDTVDLLWASDAEIIYQND